MRETQTLKNFFNDQHKKWRGRAYTLIHFTCKNAPFVSRYGKCVNPQGNEKTERQTQGYHPKRD